MFPSQARSSPFIHAPQRYQWHHFWITITTDSAELKATTISFFSSNLHFSLAVSFPLFLVYSSFGCSLTLRGVLEKSLIRGSTLDILIPFCSIPHAFLAGHLPTFGPPNLSSLRGVYVVLLIARHYPTSARKFFQSFRFLFLLLAL